MATTFGFGPVQSPAPAPVPTQPDPGQPQARAYKPSMLDILQGMLFEGQSPAEASLAARSRDYAIRNMQAMAPLISNLPADQQIAARLNPGKFAEELAKNFSPQTVAGGSTAMFEGPNGPQRTAPLMGIDKESGSPYILATSNGSTLSVDKLPSLGGDFGAKDGLITSGRTGQVAGRYATAQTLPPGSRFQDFLPGVVGAQTGVAGPVSAPGGDGPGVAPASAPRGIRNNNFGNVKALPNGQTWQGQTGVDDQGHVIFDTPQNGAAAARQNLSAYATRHGINTVAGLVDRWAGANASPATKQNYATYLAGTLHVDPNQKVDLTDPAVQRPILKGIFAFENGPQAMAAWRMPGGGGQGASGGGSVSHTLAQGNMTRNLSPEEARAGGYAAGSVVTRHPDGTETVTQEGYTPSKILEMRNSVAKDPAMDDYHKALDAWGAMVNSAKLPQGGMRAYALRDTFARLINPGAVARVGTIDALKHAQGVPANVEAYLMNLKGDGDVPPEIAQQIMSVAHGFLASHYQTVKRINDSTGDYAKRVGVDPALAMAPLDDLPGRFFLQLPRKDQLQPGDQVAGRGGVLTWDGKQFMRGQ